MEWLRFYIRHNRICLPSSLSTLLVTCLPLSPLPSSLSTCRTPSGDKIIASAAFREEISGRSATVPFQFLSGSLTRGKFLAAGLLALCLKWFYRYVYHTPLIFTA